MRLTVALLGALLGTSVHAATAPPPAPFLIPVKDFTRFEEFGGVKISPDGKFLALLTGKNGRTTVAFVDVEHNQTDAAVSAPEHSEIDYFRWLSPTRLLVSTARRYSELSEATATNRAFAIERNGRQRTPLYCCAPWVLWSTPASLPVVGDELLGIDDARHVTMAGHAIRKGRTARQFDPYMKPKIYRLDTYTGASTQLEIAPLRGARLLLDRAGQVRFALGLNEFSKLALSWKQQSDAQWTPLFLKELRNHSVVPLRFSSDDRSVFLRGVREGETLASLYRLDLPTGRYHRVHTFANAEVDAVITDFADREIVGVRGYAERTVEHWLLPDDPAAQTYEALRRAFPGQRVTLTSATSDGRTAIVRVDADTNPGDYYLFDTVSKKAQFLRAARAWIDPRQMRPKEPITLRARDGLELHGYVTRPAREGPLPMIVIPHDGPFGVRDTWEFDWEVQLLASRGYAVLQVNYRGSPGYGMDFERAAYGEWGAKVQDDIADATRWAIDQRIANAHAICIYGKVFGGYAALMGLVREPDLYRCAIGYNGVYDLELARSNDAQWGDKSVELAFGSDAAERRARSPALNARSIGRDALNAQKIKGQVLLIYGEPAWNSDSEHARNMRYALEKSGKQVEMLPVIRHDTQLYDENTRREVYERILRFLAATLSARPGTP